MTDRLYRSPTDRVIAGVAGGLATWMNLDPSLVRVGWVLLAILSGGIFVLVYIAMMIIVPLPPPGWAPRPRSGAGAWSPGGGTPTGAGAVPGWQPGSSSWGSTPGAGGPAPDATGPAWTDPAQPWAAPSQSWTPSPRTTGNAGIVVGAILVLLGIWFLVDRYVHVDWSLLWPIVVIVLGAALIVGAVRRSRPS